MMKMKNKAKWLHGSVIVVLLAIMIFCFQKMVPEAKSQIQSAATTEHITKVIQSNTNEENFLFSRIAWQQLHNENEDFKAYLAFQFGLIQLPVVQSYDNERYLSTSFDGSYDGAGTVFMECSASLDSQNITLFGHYVYYDSSSRFTPLEKLLDQQGYEDNQVIFLFLEKEIRTYLVSSIFFITEEEAEYYDYSCPDMTVAEYTDWLSFVNMKNLIEPTAGKVSQSDRILTLQTCKKWDPSQRQLVICREISRVPY